MASFTDRIPQFNPYVSQQPVDAMVKVGMMKQQQYDTNLQKIQQSMSNIAGLQIGRDVDKEYLEQKMSEMNNQLGVYAGSDLSSNKLTTHLRSMVGGIAQDEVVQNSVRSTMAVQAARKLQSKYNADGKGSPSNDWLLNTQLQKYYNDPEAGAMFSGTYKPYQDYNAKALSVIKGVLEDEKISEKDYYIDENTGKVVFSDISVETKVAGRAKEKIQTALMAQLSPAEWEQISIDGRYQYANKSGEAFAEDINTSYNTRIQELNKEKEDLISKQKIASNPREKDKFAQQLTELETRIGRQTSEYGILNDYFQNENYEGAKAKLFTMNWMNNTANAFSSSKTSETFKRAARADFAFDRQKEARRILEWNANYVQKDSHHADNVKLAKDRIKQQKIANNIAAGAGGYGGGYGPTLDPKDQKELLKVTPEVLQEEINISAKENFDKKAQVGKYYVTEEQFRSSEELRNNPKLTFDEYAAGWVENKRLKWEENPAAVSSKVNKFFTNEAKAVRQNDTKQWIKDQAVLKSDERYRAQLDALLPESENISYSVTLNDGEVIQYTTKDLIDLNSKYDELIKSVKNYIPVGASMPMPLFFSFIDQKMADRTLTEDQKKLLNIKFKQDKEDLQTVFGWTDLSPRLNSNIGEDEQEVFNHIKEAENTYSYKTAELFQDKTNFEKQYIADRLYAMQGNTHSIDLSTKQQPGGSNMDQFKGVLMGLANDADKKGGLANSPGVTGENLRDLAADLESAVISIVEDVPTGEGVERGNIYSLTVMNSKGGKKTIRLDEKNYQSIFKGRFQRGPLLERFNEYKQRIIGTSDSSMPIGTTALDGKATNKNNAYLGKVDFPNIKYFNVTGNLISDNGASFNLEVNIKSPLSGKWLEGHEMLTDMLDVDMQQQMDTLDDYILLSMFLGRNPTDEEYKAFIEQAEKMSN